MMIDAPTLPASMTSGEVPAICIAYAAAAFELPPRLIVAILKAENGRVGMEKRNTNGTYDLGPGQLNTVFVPLWKEYGIDAASVRDDGCLNVWLVGWTIRLGINSANHYWRGVGRYHSSTMRAGRDLNGEYAIRAWKYYASLSKLDTSWWGVPGWISLPLIASAPDTAGLLAAEAQE